MLTATQNARLYTRVLRTRHLQYYHQRSNYTSKLPKISKSHINKENENENKDQNAINKSKSYMHRKVPAPKYHLSVHSQRKVGRLQIHSKPKYECTKKINVISKECNKKYTKTLSNINSKKGGISYFYTNNNTNSTFNKNIDKIKILSKKRNLRLFKNKRLNGSQKQSYNKQRRRNLPPILKKNQSKSQAKIQNNKSQRQPPHPKLKNICCLPAIPNLKLSNTHYKQQKPCASEPISSRHSNHIRLLPKLQCLKSHMNTPRDISHFDHKINARKKIESNDNISEPVYLPKLACKAKSSLNSNPKAAKFSTNNKKYTNKIQYRKKSKYISSDSMAKINNESTEETEIVSLARRWFELSFLLRNPIKKNADTYVQPFERIHTAANNGLRFLSELNATAERFNILRGKLSRCILPFDTNTCVADQTIQLEMSDNFEKMLDPEIVKKIEKQYRNHLIKEAIALRKLVRLKIADDADLDQAKEALLEITQFYVDIQKYCQKQNMSLDEVIKELEK